MGVPLRSGVIKRVDLLNLVLIHLCRQVAQCLRMRSNFCLSLCFDTDLISSSSVGNSGRCFQKAAAKRFQYCLQHSHPCPVPEGASPAKCRVPLAGHKLSSFPLSGGHQQGMMCRDWSLRNRTTRTAGLALHRILLAGQLTAASCNWWGKFSSAAGEVKRGRIWAMVCIE